LTNRINDFCAKILALDKGIRFVGIANKEGTLIGHARRKGFVPLLNANETKMMLLQSMIRMGTRSTLEDKLGQTLYAFAHYKNVKRATIPMRNASGITHIMLVSFDPQTNHEPIIVGKILPAVEQFAV
jgi:hypothetical protein